MKNYKSMTDNPKKKRNQTKTNGCMIYLIKFKVLKMNLGEITTIVNKKAEITILFLSQVTSTTEAVLIW